MDRKTKIRRFCNVILLLAAACTQYTNLLMAHQATSQPSKRASWSDEETDAFLTYLHEHRSEAGDGGFKPSVFNGAASHIAPLLAKDGVVKDPTRCKTKWNSVHDFITNEDLTHSLQMKTIYTAIETYRNTSGVHWDHINGANIQGEAAESVWNAYVSHKVC